MSQDQAPYHTASSLTVLNGEQEPWIVDGRMAAAIRALLEWESDIMDTTRNVKITLNLSGKRTVRSACERYQLTN